MATTTTTSRPLPIKKLVEHLQDQQEPFNLHVYLSQRRYAKKAKKSFSVGSKNGVPHGSKTLELVLGVLTSYKSCRKLLGFPHKARRNGEKDCKAVRKQEKIAKSRLCSSGGSLALSSSCSKASVKASCSTEQNHNLSCQRIFRAALKLHNLRRLEAALNSKHQWGCMEENNQLSPASVLEELPSEEGSPVVQNFLAPRKEGTASTCNFKLSRQVKEDLIFSATMCQLLAQSHTAKHNCVPATKQLKRVLMQPKQLVFDCVKEAIDSHGMGSRRQKRIIGKLGAEELGKIVCEQICAWENQCGDETDVKKLIGWDYSSTEEEWRDLNVLTRDVGVEIGDAILDDIVVEMINLL